MPRKYQTKAAAQFLAEAGEKTSFRTLHAYRLRGPGDPGERGPDFYRDPDTGVCWYFESDLVAWIERRQARLIKRGTGVRPAHLGRDKAA